MTTLALNEMSDVELEVHIADLGRLFLKAHGEGNMALAAEWLAAQTKAVKSRSAAQVARLEEDYFGSMGEASRRAAEARKT